MIAAISLALWFVTIIIFVIKSSSKKEEKSNEVSVDLLQENLSKIKEEYLSQLKKEYSSQEKENLEALKQYELQEREKINKKLEEISQYCEEIVAQELNQKINQENKNCQTKIKELQRKCEEESEEFFEQVNFYKHQYKNIKEKVDNATAAAKREEEKKDNIYFYQLHLPAEDIQDIKQLKEIEKKLSRPDVLDKLIYKVYLEKPTTDLVNRVIGPMPVTGIYKITNTLNQMTYVGQSVDLRARWRQHIKRAIGAETPLKNKLYPAMAENGVWNFTFEVVEICNKEDLNEKEQFWQEHFNSKTYGYSMK